MSRACDDAMAKIYPYLDDEMTWYRRTRIRYHLRRCPPCVSRFGFETRLRRVVRERAQEEPPPDMIMRLQAFLREHRDDPLP